MKVFEVSSYTGHGGWNWLLWGSSVLYIVYFYCLTLYTGSTRWGSTIEKLLAVPLSLVNKCKMRIFSGSHLAISTLWVIVLFNNMWAILPEVPSSGALMVFGFSFALPFWLTGVLSSLFLGRGGPTASNTVKGLNWLTAIILWWSEFFSVSVRWLTLTLRLTANMFVGQLMISAVGSVHTYCVRRCDPLSLLLWDFTFVPWFIAFEACVTVIQSYVFVILLSMYWDDHSFR